MENKVILYYKPFLWNFYTFLNCYVVEANKEKSENLVYIPSDCGFLFTNTKTEIAYSELDFSRFKGDDEEFRKAAEDKYKYLKDKRLNKNLRSKINSCDLLSVITPIYGRFANIKRVDFCIEAEGGKFAYPYWNHICEGLSLLGLTYRVIKTEKNNLSLDGEIEDKKGSKDVNNLERTFMQIERSKYFLSQGSESFHLAHAIGKKQIILSSDTKVLNKLGRENTFRVVNEESLKCPELIIKQISKFLEEGF